MMNLLLFALVAAAYLATGGTMKSHFMSFLVGGVLSLVTFHVIKWYQLKKEKSKKNLP